MLSNRFVSANAKNSVSLSITLFFLFCLIGFLNNALAEEQSDDEIEEKQYEVEIIVFARTNVSNSETETWAEKTELPTITNNVELVNSFELLTDPEIDQLPFFYLEPDFASNDDFSKYLNRMSKNPKYNVLLHRIWRQAVDENSSGIPVYIASKSDELLYQPIEKPAEIVEQTEEMLVIDTDNDADTAESFLMQSLEEEQKMIAEMIQLREKIQPDPLDPIIPFDENPNIPESHPVDLSPMGPPEHKIYGTVRLSKSRFMHMNLDFVYRDQEIITEHTIYPQLIQAEWPIVDSVDNLLETESGAENSFIISPENGISNFANNETVNQESKAIMGIEPDEELFRKDVVESEIVDESLEPKLEITEEEAASEQDQAESFLTPEKPPFIGYRLEDSKRVRLSRVYYFDHPMFGIIARVIRYEPPKEVVNVDN